MTARITYIYHDCFVVQTDEAAFVFDYWKDPTSADAGSPRFLDEIDPAKPLYVLVSHHHKDHFTRDVFSWAKRFEHIRFIISHDVFKAARHMLRPDSIWQGYRPPLDTVVDLRRLETYTDSIAKITAYGSTDIGNSYLIETGGMRIFHAGDLNAWVWKDESTPAEVAAAIRDFNKCLDPLQAYLEQEVAPTGPSIDIAMFPVDSRIGHDYWTGASIFVRRFDVRCFIPMHFGLGADAEEERKFVADATAFPLYANPDRGVYIPLTVPYEGYEYFGN